jgi:hypothetical protein
MSRAAANELTIRGLDDIIQMAEVCTVVMEQGGSLTEEEVMTPCSAICRALPRTPGRSKVVLAEEALVFRVSVEANGQTYSLRTSSITSSTVSPNSR